MNEIVGNKIHRVGSLRERLSDCWITARVKSRFIFSDKVSGINISVRTVGGVVILDGRVESGRVQELAIALARNIRGVNNVVWKNLVY